MQDQSRQTGLPLSGMVSMRRWIHKLNVRMGIGIQGTQRDEGIMGCQDDEFRQDLKRSLVCDKR